MTTAHDLATNAPPGVCLIFDDGTALTTNDHHPVAALDSIPDDLARLVVAVTVHATGVARNMHDDDRGKSLEERQPRPIVVLFARTRSGDDAARIIDADGITTPASPALGAIPDAAARLFAVR